MNTDIRYTYLPIPPSLIFNPKPVAPFRRAKPDKEPIRPAPSPAERTSQNRHVVVSYINLNGTRLQVLEIYDPIFELQRKLQFIGIGLFEFGDELQKMTLSRAAEESVDSWSVQYSESVNYGDLLGGKYHVPSISTAYTTLSSESGWALRCSAHSRATSEDEWCDYISDGGAGMLGKLDTTLSNSCIQWTDLRGVTFVTNATSLASLQLPAGCICLSGNETRH